MASKHLVFWLTAIVVFILDRISKTLVLEKIPLNTSIDFSLLSITHILNTGTVFGLLGNISWFFIIFATAVCVFLVIKYKTFENNMQPILGLILGGALGNLVDRLLYGAVIDFIDFRFWPAFNIADSAITIAIILILIHEYWPRKRKV